jgi:hypothetical protein
VIGGQRCFKGGKLGAKAEVRGAEDLDDSFDFGFGNIGRRERYGRGIEVRGFPGLKIETGGTRLSWEFPLRTHGRPLFPQARALAA